MKNHADVSPTWNWNLLLRYIVALHHGSFFLVALLGALIHSSRLSWTYWSFIWTKGLPPKKWVCHGHVLVRISVVNLTAELVQQGTDFLRLFRHECIGFLLALCLFFSTPRRFLEPVAEDLYEVAKISSPCFSELWVYRSSKASNIADSRVVLLSRFLSIINYLGDPRKDRSSFFAAISYNSAPTCRGALDEFYVGHRNTRMLFTKTVHFLFLLTLLQHKEDSMNLCLTQFDTGRVTLFSGFVIAKVTKRHPCQGYIKNKCFVHHVFSMVSSGHPLPPLCIIMPIEPHTRDESVDIQYFCAPFLDFWCRAFLRVQHTQDEEWLWDQQRRWEDIIN